jgi:hypothetical protein
VIADCGLLSRGLLGESGSTDERVMRFLERAQCLLLAHSEILRYAKAGRDQGTAEMAEPIAGSTGS